MITNNELLQMSEVLTYGRAHPAMTLVRPLGLDPYPRDYSEKEMRPLPQPFVATLNNVHLAGPAAVGLLDRRPILDTAYAGRMDVLERNRPYLRWAVGCLDRYEPVKYEALCSLVGVWSGNYFHWMLEMLPKLEGLFAWEKANGIEAMILVEQHAPRFVYESLTRLGLGTRVVAMRDPLILADTLVIPTTRRYQGFTYPCAVEWLRRRTKPHEGYFTKQNIYISRANAGKRHVENWLDLHELLAEYNFMTLDPGNFRWSNQISIFYQADMILAPHGAGIANMVFARDTPALVELVTPEYVNPCYWLLAQAMEADYSLAMCHPRPGENMIADTKILRRVIEQLCKYRTSKTVTKANAVSSSATARA